MSDTYPIRATCHCGTVAIGLTRRPAYINECNCTLCAKSGAWWGYFDAAEVAVRGPTQVYLRADRATPSAEIHFCARCGATSHVTLTPSFIADHPKAVSHRAVNMRLFDIDALAGVELRFPDGRAWDGTGDHGFVRAGVTLGLGEQ